MDMKKLDKYMKLIEDQFTYGGKKYGLNSSKESTDVLFDNHGKNWLFGTIDKYTFRYQNLARERDILKIGTYMFILWLKRGFHIDDKRVIPLDTSVKIKSKEFPKFVKEIEKYFIVDKTFEKFSDWLVRDHEKRFINKEIISLIGNINKEVERWSEKDWINLKSKDILDVFLMSYGIWQQKYSDSKKHDTDTWNEKKNGKSKKR